MDFDFYFCDTNRTMVKWLVELEKVGTEILYNTPTDSPGVGDIWGYVVALNAARVPEVKSNGRLNLPTGPFVIIARS